MAVLIVLLIGGGLYAFWSGQFGQMVADSAPTPTPASAETDASPTAAETPQQVIFPTDTPLPLPTLPSEAAERDTPDLVGTAQAEAPEPQQTDLLFDSQRFSYAPNFYQPEVEAFLANHSGTLNEVSFQIGDRSHSFADVLVSQTALYSINPKILLALLEQQSQLITTVQPSPDQLTWAMGYYGDDGNRAGLYSQLRWAIIAVRHGLRDYAIGSQQGALPPLVFADDNEQAVNPDIGLARYVLSRVLARTTTADALEYKLNQFLEVYIALFDDPRYAPQDWPPAAEPFLTSPMEEPFRVTSFFDHNLPFLQQNGSLTSFWGTTEEFLSYDGHTGWDYALMYTDPIVAAAAGRVVFAGNSDDGCATPAGAVIIEHSNGYRTLYWHFSRIDVETGQAVAAGDQLGLAGATGCSFGPHLHLQVQYLGRDVDPYGWCGSTASPWEANPTGQINVWLWADMINPCDTPPDGTIVVDNSSPGFVSDGEWQRSNLGYGGDALFGATSQVVRTLQPWQLRPLPAKPAVAIWQPDLPTDGRYRVMAYIPYILNGLDDSQEIRYLVAHSDGETIVPIDAERHANYWVDLGTYQFDGDGPARVVLSSLAGDEGRGIWVDAVAWVPVR